MQPALSGSSVLRISKSARVKMDLSAPQPMAPARHLNVERATKNAMTPWAASSAHQKLAPVSTTLLNVPVTTTQTPVTG